MMAGMRLGDVVPRRRQKRARAPLEQVLRENLIPHDGDAVDHLLGAAPSKFRRLDRTIECRRQVVEARALGGDGRRFRLILRRWSEPLDLAFHLDKLRAKRLGCRGRVVDDFFDLGAQTLQLALQLLELLDRFLSRRDVLGQSLDGRRHLGWQQRGGGRRRSRARRRCRWSGRRRWWCGGGGGAGGDCWAATPSDKANRTATANAIRAQPIMASAAPVSAQPKHGHRNGYVLAAP